MTAIVLESIALLLFWPGLISDTVTYAEVPRSGNLYAAIFFSVTLSLGSCAALYFGVRARRTDKPGVAATVTLFASLGLILSVVIALQRVRLRLLTKHLRLVAIVGIA